ncbi:hypothetical protein D1872_36040 [compost metagenome]
MDGVIFLPEETPRVYVGVQLADIHTGPIEPEQWLYELTEGFIKPVKKLAILDYIVIAGDYFDSKLSMNSKAAKYGLKFFTMILELCEEKGAKLRVIKGTESHDNKQLDILRVMGTASKCDVRIIESVETEQLFPDFNVLYIPEEYMEDKDAYYAPYFEQRYQLIVGHGLVNEALPFAVTQESESTMSKAPILDLDTMLSICDGYIYFGHIHKSITIKERFRYINSFSRWAFGEEEDKGFCIYYYEPESKTARNEYIVNKYARRYDTIEVICNPESESSEKEQIEYLLRLANSMVKDYLRMEVTIPEEHPNPALITNMINETFQRHRNIKIKLINNGKLRKEKEVHEKIKKLLDTYDFVFDKKALPEEKLSKFIKIRYNKEINIDKMKRYLYESLMKGA